MQEQQQDVILVNESDRPIGIEEKLKAHKEGLLHRAFSVQIIDLRDYWLLQQRALGKYHCPGLWTNTCCSHPKPEETTIAAAHRRLKEEMGFDCPLKEKYSFVYKSIFENRLTENEFDHVFFGTFTGNIEDICTNPKEVADHIWIKPEHLKEDMLKFPQKYTPWFQMIAQRFFNEQK